MSTLIIPACGQSTRFPGMRPKFLLTHPISGHPMFLEGIKGLNLSSVNDIYLVVLEEHENTYLFRDKIEEITRNWLSDKRYTCRFSVLVLPSSKSPAHTIQQAIDLLKIEGQIHIKDCDNYFDYDIKDCNAVVTYDLHETTKINPANKSYVKGEYYLKDIADKIIISNEFCCGMYSFKSAKEFCEAYHLGVPEFAKLNEVPSTIYIITYIKKYKNSFIITRASSYIDWGTSEDWLSYCSQFKTYFVDIDGVLFQNSAEYMYPYWGTSEPIQDNIDRINKLYNKGNKIILTTGRSEEYRHSTLKQLGKADVLFDQLVMECGHCKRVIINDYSTTNPYPSCEALSIERNGKLEGKL